MDNNCSKISTPLPPVVFSFKVNLHLLSLNRFFRRYTTLLLLTIWLPQPPHTPCHCGLEEMSSLCYESLYTVQIKDVTEPLPSCHQQLQLSVCAWASSDCSLVCCSLVAGPTSYITFTSISVKQ